MVTRQKERACPILQSAPHWTHPLDIGHGMLTAPRLVQDPKVLIGFNTTCKLWVSILPDTIGKPWENDGVMGFYGIVTLW